MFDQAQGIIIPDWPAPVNVQALVTTRISFNKSNKPLKLLRGYEHFNLALHVNDDPKQVALNRAQLAQYLKRPTSNITWLEQVHGTKVICADANLNKAITADASTSQTPHNVCAIMTADCLPVLFCNIPEANEPLQVAAAHAGWRGLADGILTQTLAKFSQPKSVIAWLGPAISQTNFEVGQEVYDAFTIQSTANKKAFIPSQNTTPESPKWLASLTTLAKLELHKAGVKAVYDSEMCTYEQPELFYSYRRDGAQSGRIASLIMIS